MIDPVDNSEIYSAVSVPNEPTDDELANAQLSGVTVSSVSLNTNDSDGDGVCDDDEVAGCQDSTACNYNADATDDADDCTYAADGFDCAGNCLSGELVTFSLSESYGDGGSGTLSYNDSVIVSGVPYAGGWGAGTTTNSVTACFDLAVCGDVDF